MTDLSLADMIDALSRTAANASGGSESLYVRIFSDSVDAAFAETASDRQVAIEVARQYDYADVKIRYVADDPTLCWHGLPYDCCPAGCGEDNE